MAPKEWRDVIGYEGRYQVSRDGDVKSLNYHRQGFEKVLKFDENKSGYRLASFSTKSAMRKFTIHSLVAASFIGPRPEGMQINHINGIKHDNRAENLEYVTQPENMKHAYATGLQRPHRGSQHVNAVLDEEKVRSMFRRKSEGCTGRQIAKDLGVGEGTVSQILRGLRWKHVSLGVIHGHS
jgi:hypothetical protein